jgi:hypothetical protein
MIVIGGGWCANPLAGTVSKYMFAPMRLRRFCCLVIPGCRLKSISALSYTVATTCVRAIILIFVANCLLSYVLVVFGTQ